MDTNNIDKLANSLDTIGLDEYIKLTQPTHSIAKAVSNNLFGFNNQKTLSLLLDAKDDYGFAFFTRPQLNMTTDNLRGYRKFYDLLNNREDSILRYVRSTLDPKLIYTEGLKSTFVDDKMAFIPLLTNVLESMDGWPDPVLESYTTPEGLRKEQFSMIDSCMDIYNSFTLDCTFRNIINDPVTLLFAIWTIYPTLTFENILAPYTVFILENALDYNTRIYRLVMDETRTFVKKISATGASYPVNVPFGKMFDYKNNETYNTQNKSITIRFECNGAMYNDSILCKEFNMTGEIFNDELYKLNRGEPNSLEKIPRHLTSYFNYRAYPRINLDTTELEWYVDVRSKTYEKVIKMLDLKV